MARHKVVYQYRICRKSLTDGRVSHLQQFETFLDAKKATSEMGGDYQYWIEKIRIKETKNVNS